MFSRFSFSNLMPVGGISPSAQCQDLLHRMFVEQPTQRLTIQGIMVKLTAVHVYRSCSQTSFCWYCHLQHSPRAVPKQKLPAKHSQDLIEAS